MPTWELVIIGTCIGVGLIAASLYWAFRPASREVKSRLPDAIERQDGFHRDANLDGSTFHGFGDHP